MRQVPTVGRWSAQRRQHPREHFTSETSPKGAQDGECPRSGCKARDWKPTGDIDREAAALPRKSGEAIAHQAGKRIQRGHQDADLLKRNSCGDLPCGPVCRRLDFRFHTRMFFEFDCAVWAAATEARLVGEYPRWLKQKRSEQSPLGAVSTRNSGRA